MKDWHRTDVFAALTERGWSAPSPLSVLPEQARYVGEAYGFTRNGKSVDLFFVADFGTGLNGRHSIEAAIAMPSDEQLWFRRARDSKWRRALTFWANRISGMPRAGSREPNLPFRP